MTEGTSEPLGSAEDSELLFPEWEDESFEVSEDDGMTSEPGLD